MHSFQHKMEKRKIATLFFIVAVLLSLFSISLVVYSNNSNSSGIYEIEGGNLHIEVLPQEASYTDDSKEIGQ